MIRCQLDAVVGLALHCGLRRREIFQLDLEAMHDDNAYVVVLDEPGNWWGSYRTVGYTDSSRALIAPWCRIRSAVAPERSRAWLNLHAEPTARQPMTRDTFNKLLRTYMGAGWSLSRLRATCGVAWAKTGLLPEHLRQLLGYSSIIDVLPYMALVGGDVERQMNRREAAFRDQLTSPA
jgi:site-specific recombinase XerD